MSDTEARTQVDGVDRDTPVFEVQDLTVRFHTALGVAHAVNGLSFKVGSGECVAIVGESGSGKSAGLLASLRLLPSPPSQTVRGSSAVNGVDLFTLTPKQLREVLGRDVAMVFQDALSSFNPVLTVGRQISEGARRHKGLSKREADRLAVRMLGEVGVPDPEERARQYPHQLSGGMRQRAMIAMALAGDPKLLIADEPTTALDVTVQAQILDLVRGLTETAVVWVTHDLGVVAGLADRVIVMYAGFVVEDASVDEAFHNPRHPYTKALLGSVPKFRDPERGDLASIQGLPPSLIDLPEGCPFYDRCTVREDRCREQRPPLEPVGDGHLAACFVAQSKEPERV